MIPSTTKLALLSGILLIAKMTDCNPVYRDERQEGNVNGRADVEDIALFYLGMSDKDTDLLEKILESMLPTFTAQRSLHEEEGKTKTPSKHGFVLAEKSPYKVDLAKSKVPVEAVIKEEVTKKPLETSKKTTVKNLKLIGGGGLEECGPDGHRDEKGMCIFNKARRS